MDTVKLIKIISDGLDELNEEKVLPDDLLELMVENLGDISSELRDDIIHNGFRKILRNDLITNEQKNKLLKYIINERLMFKNIEAEFDNSVYTRSFSSLLLVELLKNHYRNHWILPEQEKEIIHYSNVYLNTETDNRGLVDDYGWAHAFAHGADLMGTIAESNYYTTEDCEHSLKALHRALIKIENFLYGEEGRLAKATTSILLSKRVDDRRISEWIIETSKELITSGEFNLCWPKYLMALHYSAIAEKISTERLCLSIESSVTGFYEQYGCL